MWLMLLILAFPFIEIALFIKIGGWIGVWPTLALVILAAVVGAAVVRTQGIGQLRRLQTAIETNRDPSGPLAHGALIAAAGVLLILPGFLSDAIGLLLLIPPVRGALIRALGRRVQARTVVFTQSRPDAPPRDYAGDAIEGEYEVLDDVPPSERGASGWTRPRS